MLGKLVVLCLCLALASAKPARSVRLSHHFGLIKSCDADQIMSDAESIVELSTTFAKELIEEVDKIKAYFAICSNPLDILLCATKGVKGIVSNAKLITANVKEYMSEMSTDVPALVAQVKACL